MVASSFQADTVFKGANIVTVDPKTPRAQALAMKDGKFVGVGSDSDIEGLIGPNTRVQDMRGKTIIPGLIDAHIHVLSSGTRHVMAADCDQRSIAEVQASLRERVESAGRGEWIQGFKFVWPLPMGGVEGTGTYKRFLGLLMVDVGGPTSGAINAFLTFDPSGWTSYPDASN